MKPFLLWLEEEDKNNLKDALLHILHLDEDGLSTPLEAFDSSELLSQLDGLGEFKSLSAEKQNEIKTIINQQKGTVGDLVDAMTGMDTGSEESALQPPRGKEEPKQEPEPQPEQPQAPPEPMPNPPPPPGQPPPA